MKLTQQQRIEVAVYVIIGASAIVVAAISTIYLKGTAQDFFLSLAADFFGVAVLFFLVNRFFGLNPEGTVSKRTETLFNLVEQRFKILNNDKEAKEKFPIEELIQSAEQLDIVGYNLNAFLNSFRGTIINRVQQGAQVRVLVIDPKSPSREILYQYSTIHLYDSDIVTTLEYVRFIEGGLSRSQKRIKGSFEFRLTGWIPSCSLTIIDPSKPSGMINIAVNTPNYRTPKFEGRLHLVFRQEEQPEWFAFFAKQFEGLWAESYPWDGSDPQFKEPLQATGKVQSEAQQSVG